MPARDRRGQWRGTYPFYKIGVSFILHYPHTARRKRGGGTEVVYLGGIFLSQEDMIDGLKIGYHRVSPVILWGFAAAVRCSESF